MKTARGSILGLSLGFLVSACASSGSSGGTGGSTGNGGTTGSGTGGMVVITGTGGMIVITGNGGDNGTGGSSSGGNTGSGGTVSTGGNTGNGGSSATGGNTGNGGSSATGGNTGNGGSSATGGSTGNGGATGTGGSPPAQPLVVTSSGATGASTYWVTGTLTTSTANATVTVNDNGTMQTWEGFGGAFNELGASYLSMLSSSDQGKALDLLFGSDAAHFGIGRIPIGASDYATSRYTDDETAGDTSLANFSISRDQQALIPYVKAAMNVNPNLRFWASPWTPPTWMKTFTGSNSNGTSCKPVGSTNFDGGCMNATSTNQTAFANYLAKWVSAYNGQGIKIDTIAPQNEPNYAQGYPSCLWNTTDYVNFVKGPLAQAFPSSGNTKIMLGTMSNGDNGATSFDLKVVQAVEADATAKALPVVMGLQWGMLDLYEGLVSGVSSSNFMTGSLPVWATEHKCGNYPWNPTGTNPGTGQPYTKYVEPAPNDQAYGVETWDYIRNAITKAKVTAYNAWNMILDTQGKGNDMTRSWSQDSLLVVNTSSKTLIVTPAYYVFRHCAQYVQIGAKVLTTSGGDAVAFKNPDGSEVVAMYNSGSAGTYTVAIKGAKYQFMMPGNGWATVFAP